MDWAGDLPGLVIWLGWAGDLAGLEISLGWVCHVGLCWVSSRCDWVWIFSWLWDLETFDWVGDMVGFEIWLGWTFG